MRRTILDEAVPPRAPCAGIVKANQLLRIVDLEGCQDALEGGRLSGAVIDVFDAEPLAADSPLWHVRNLIVTPHVTSDDADQYMSKTLDLVFANLRRLQDGRTLLNRVDPLKGY